MKVYIWLQTLCISLGDNTSSWKVRQKYSFLKWSIKEIFSIYTDEYCIHGKKMGNVSYNGDDESGGEMIFQSFSILFFSIRLCYNFIDSIEWSRKKGVD